MKNKNIKISNAGYRMLEVLKILCKKPLTAQEMLFFLEDVTDNSYRKELILKYINTLKLLGLDIVKVDGKYLLNRSLESIDFDKNDLSLMKFIQRYVSKIPSKDLQDNISDSLNVMERNFSSKTTNLINNFHIKSYKITKPTFAYCENIKKIEQYCKDELKIELTYKSNIDKSEQKYCLAPIKIVYKKEKAFLIAFNLDTKEYKEFWIKNIMEVKQLPQKHTQCLPISILFKLKNRLAKSYVLKPNEVVLEYGKDFLIISNKGEDKEMLMKRLLRYYDQCEILYPKAYREQMVNIIECMENLYEQS